MFFLYRLRHVCFCLFKVQRTKTCPKHVSIKHSYYAIFYPKKKNLLCVPVSLNQFKRKKNILKHVSNYLFYAIFYPQKKSLCTCVAEPIQKKKSILKHVSINLFYAIFYPQKKPFKCTCVAAPVRQQVGQPCKLIHVYMKLVFKTRILKISRIQIRIG